MHPELKKIEKELPKKGKFGFTPRYSATFHTQLSEKAFFAVAHQAFEQLDWDVVYVDEHLIVAKRKAKSWGITRYTESINVSYSYGNVTVKSESLGNEMWDNGRNSKRVNLFMYVLHDIEKHYNREQVKQLEKEQVARENWDDYVIPAALPAPGSRRKPRIFFPLFMAIVVSVVLAFALARISITGKYVIVLFELFAGVALAVSLKLGMRLGNFTGFIQLRNILIFSILVVFVGTHVFQYIIVLSVFHLEPIGIWEFTKLRLQQGLIIKTLHIGTIGLIVCWAIQLGLTYVFGYMLLAKFLIGYVIRRVPPEVIDFAIYHFIKGKDEDQVRAELALLGWSDEQQQTEVFEAVSGIQHNNELNKSTS